MDKYVVKISPKASRDIDKIFRYIAVQLKVLDTARFIIDEVKDSILSLAIMPQRGAKRKIGVYAEKNYRQIFVKNYTIVYRIDEMKKEVMIITVRYTPSKF